MTVSTPDLSRVDPAVADDYRALHRAATAGTPAARGGGFEVYRHGGRLAWVKEACEPGALMREFLAQRFTRWMRRVCCAILARRSGAILNFEARGVRFDGKCLGAARLPDFALARARLGQPGKWEVEIPF